MLSQSQQNEDPSRQNVAIIGSGGLLYVCLSDLRSRLYSLPRRYLAYIFTIFLNTIIVQLSANNLMEYPSVNAYIIYVNLAQFENIFMKISREPLKAKNAQCFYLFSTDDKRLR